MNQDKIQVKQVDGAVDTNTEQEINARKKFKAPVVFDKLSGAYHMVPFQGYIYWVTDINKLDDTGNYRIGVDETGFVQQEYTDGVWFTK